jgi:hypothetical protein
LGLILCTLAGSVAYSRRFYEEVLREPATASPLIFPETVFNAAASHLAAYLGSTEISYTLVGDDGTFLQGLVIAAQWLAQGRVDGCVVVGAEEQDWIVADTHFSARCHPRQRGGALYLKQRKRRTKAGMRCDFSSASIPAPGAKMRAGWHPDAGHRPIFAPRTSLASRPAGGLGGLAQARLARAILGNFRTSTAWRCVAACDAVRAAKFSGQREAWSVLVQQAISARFVRRIQT